MLQIKPFLTCFLLGLTTISLTSCDDQTGGTRPDAVAQNTSEIHTLADLVGKRAGSLTGSLFQGVLEKVQPGVAEYKTFNYNQPMVQALRTGKIDAALADEPIAQLWAAYYPEELYVAFNFADDYYSFATRKGDPLNAKISAVIQQLEQSGELEKFKEKWCKNTDPERSVTKWTHKKDFDGSAGTIRYATDPSQVPMSYQSNNELKGMDIEVLNRVAYELNMKVEYTKMTFSELIDTLNKGKADLVGGSMSVTPERQEVVEFVHPYYKGGMAVLARRAKKKGK